MSNQHIVIIGNGIAGVTAARHIRKKDSNTLITIISGETDYFFSRTALMYVFMGHMKFEHTQPYENWFWEKNKINLIKDWVTAINFETQELTLKKDTSIKYDKLIIATGSKPNKFGWKGQDLKGVQGLYSFQDLQLLEQTTANNKVKKAVIVGGGLIGVELAEMLLYKNIEVTFLIRENTFWGGVLPKEEGDMIANHLIKDHHVNIIFNDELEEIIPDKSGYVNALKTKKGEVLETQFVGLTVGVSPNVDFLKNTSLEINKGIVVNEYLETNIPNVFAIGDCAEIKQPKIGRRPIEAVWYTGRMMGETVAQTLTENKIKYNPGIWFNSAKFFDIEYQTYGTVSNIINENEKVFYWKHPDKNISFRAVYDKQDKHLIGINVFGIRFRHNICDNWLKNKTSIEEVIINLKSVFFDPEFYKSYEKEIINCYNKENQTKLKPKKKNIINIFGINR